MGSARRDRLVRGVRVARWAMGLAAAGLTAAFSVAAAHAFKGHDGHANTRQAASHPRVARAHVTVPGPDRVPSIAGDGSLQPPESAPQAAAPQTQQVQPAPQQAPAAPPVSGGS